jgi:hypothetical protein
MRKGSHLLDSDRANLVRWNRSHKRNQQWSHCHQAFSCRSIAGMGQELPPDPKIGFISAFIRMQMLDKRMARDLHHKH